MLEDSHKLRLELKEWEKAFSAANSGRKACREDIKQHPDIANKYKAYNKCRKSLPTETDPSAVTPSKRRRISPQPQPQRQREPSIQTPQKRVKKLFVSDASFLALNPFALTAADETPKKQLKSIGPTPQKNGQVLGLFDLLSPASVTRTPPKRPALQSLASNVVASPSRLAVEGSVADRGQLLSSASKHGDLPLFLTPSKQRCGELNENAGLGIPISKTQPDSTPAFLRRDSQPLSRPQDNPHDGPAWSPTTVRIRPTPLGRSISALAKGLRDLEDSRLDDELALLRDMENDTETSTNTKIKPQRTVVEDSQIIEMPLGRDGHEDSETEQDKVANAEEIHHKGNPQKVWKKKGQKRTTRKVTMKPSSARWKPEPEWSVGHRDDEDRKIAAVAEIELCENSPSVSKAECTQDKGVNDERQSRENQEFNQRPGSKTRERTSEPMLGQAKMRKTQGGERGRKINSTAHTNFRALRIKNKHSKGKRGSKFGRRR